MTRRGLSTWRWPVVIGTVTLVGLLLALFVGGMVGAVAGWIGLAVPTAILTAGLVRKRDPKADLFG